MTDPIELKPYGQVAKLLHWAIVILLAAQYAVAWTMPEMHRDTRPEALISLHLSLGALILILMALRLVWRLFNPVPLRTDTMPAWQAKVAEATHWSLYGLMIVMPLLGWANANARGWDPTLFGLFTLPRLMEAHSASGHLAGDVHALLANVTLALLALHVGGALYHHFRLRDGTLSRMSLRR